MSHVDGTDDGVGYGVKGTSTSANGNGVYAKSEGEGGVGVLAEIAMSSAVVGIGGVVGITKIGEGVVGVSKSNDGVVGVSESAFGVLGHSTNRYGVYGGSSDNAGVIGRNDSYTGDDPTWSLDGVVGLSGVGNGVHGESQSRDGTGVSGYSEIGKGVYSGSTKNFGVWGVSNEDFGVYGLSLYSTGVYGNSGRHIGVSGFSGNNLGVGVDGYNKMNMGVRGRSESGAGLSGFSATGLAAYLNGNVRIDGTLQKAGGRFKIDHPLDPANKYLSHSFVESPDMKNVYDGVVVLDDKGEAEIELPDWFGALNKDFRYQLTAIGAPGPNLHIAEEISDGVTNYSNSSSSNNNNNSRFKVAGGTSGMKVSWQVTGIRKDPWANTHRIQVEEDKPDKERGYYIYPDLYGKAAENGISRLLFPSEEEERKMQEQLVNK
ncbi:MAG TPA: hypothetical protein VIP70_05035 [Nitrososphaeraceae archaeon]